MRKMFFILFIALVVVFLTKKDISASAINNYLPQGDSIPSPQVDTSTSSISMVDDYVIMDKGKMLHVNGENIETFDQAMVLKNGTIIKPDGTIQPKDEEVFLLKEGQRIYIASGKVSGGKIADVN